MSQDIERLIAKDEWAEARKLIERELAHCRDDHWLLTRLSLTYYEERQYEKALEVSERAYSLAPHCPLVVWDYAGAMEMCGRRHDAIDLWEGLLSRGQESIAFDECGEGVRWAKSLLNDCRFRIANALWHLGERERASEMIATHLDHRRPGLPSTYSIKDAQRLNARIHEEQ